MRPDSKEPIPAMHPLVRRRTSRWTLLQHGRILGGCRQINLNKRRILDASTNGSHHQVWHHQDARAIILDLAMFQQSWIQDPCPAAGDGCASKNPQAMTMRPGPRIPGHSDCFHWNWLLGCRCAFQGRIHLQKPKGRQTDTGTCLGAAVAPRQEPVSGCLATVYWQQIKHPACGTGCPRTRSFMRLLGQPVPHAGMSSSRSTKAAALENHVSNGTGPSRPNHQTSTLMSPKHLQHGPRWNAKPIDLCDAPSGLMKLHLIRHVASRNIIEPALQPAPSYTSSTAQGGGGSFKNRKPIGEIGCCESPVAEQKHWWIELSNCVTD